MPQCKNYLNSTPSLISSFQNPKSYYSSPVNLKKRSKEPSQLQSSLTKWKLFLTVKINKTWNSPQNKLKTASVIWSVI